MTGGNSALSANSVLSSKSVLSGLPAEIKKRKQNKNNI
jgi:hypothetical protein